MSDFGHNATCITVARCCIEDYDAHPPLNSRLCSNFDVPARYETELFKWL